MAAQADTDVYLEELEEAASIANLRRAGYPCPLWTITFKCTKDKEPPYAERHVRWCERAYLFGCLYILLSFLATLLMTEEIPGMSPTSLINPQALILLFNVHIRNIVHKKDGAHCQGILTEKKGPTHVQSGSIKPIIRIDDDDV